ALPPGSVGEFQARWGDRVTWHELPPVRDRLADRVLRQSKAYAQLYWRPDIQLKRLRRPTRWRPRVLDTVARVIGRANAGPRRIARLDALHHVTAARAPHMKAFESLLAEVRPDVVFNAHQKAVRAVPVMLAARELGIPSATFVYSWDNLPKGRMAVYADHY